MSTPALTTKAPNKKLSRVENQLLIQIMIGSIPVNIVPAKPEMVTHTEENDILYSLAQQKNIKSHDSLKQSPKSTFTKKAKAGFNLASTFSTQKEDPEAMLVLVIGTSSAEEQLQEMRREMHRMIEEKYVIITKLTSQLAQQAILYSQESMD